MAIRLFPRGHLGSRPPTGPFTINRDSPQAKGLAAWFPPLRYRTNVYIDLVSGIIGTFNGTVDPWIDKDVGFAHLFDATTDFINIPDNDIFSANPELTVSVWFIPDSVTGGQLVVSKGSTSYEWEMGPFGTAVRCSTRVAAGGFHLDVSGSTIAIGDLVHLVMTVNVSTPILSAYKNGVLVGTDTTAANTPYANGTAPLRIARRADNSNQFYGKVGDVRIYNRILTPAEVYQQWSPETRWDLYLSVAPRFWSVPAAAPPAGVAMPIFGNDDQLFGSIFGGAIVR